MWTDQVEGLKKNCVCGVYFLDHFTTNSRDVSDGKKNSKCFVVGVLVDEDNDFIYLANWIDEDSENSPHTEINAVLKKAVYAVKLYEPKPIYAKITDLNICDLCKQERLKND